MSSKIVLGDRSTDLPPAHWSLLIMSPLRPYEMAKSELIEQDNAFAVSLPGDIMHQIVKDLDIATLMSFSQTGKNFFALVDDNQDLWEVKVR